MYNSLILIIIYINSALEGIEIITTRPSLTATACSISSRRIRNVRRSKSNLRRLRLGNQRYRLTLLAPPLLLYPLGTLYLLHLTLLLLVTTLLFSLPLFTQLVIILLLFSLLLFTQVVIIILLFQLLQRIVQTL